MTILCNDSGEIRKIPTGLSWGGFFFGPFAFLAHGPLKSFFSWVGIWIIGMLLIGFAVWLFDLPHSNVIMQLYTVIVRAYFGIRLNKILAAAWLKKGYKISGEVPNEVLIY